MAIVCFAPRLCILLLLLLLCAVAGAPPPRKKVAVEGVVYCKFCERDATNSSHYWLHQLYPLLDATVRLQCNNSARGSWEVEVKTDGGGKFLIQPERVSSRGAHKCKLFLVSSPRSDCVAPIYPQPGFNNAPWKYGFPLTKTNSTLTLQYYASAIPLLYYYYWPSCK